MIAGLLLAVGCALAGSGSVLIKQRGAVAAPAVLAHLPDSQRRWPVSLEVVNGGMARRAGRVAVARGALSLASLSIVRSEPPLTARTKDAYGQHVGAHGA